MITKASNVLTTKARDALPKREFAIPEKEKYPIHDEAHARNALARVSQFGSPEEKARVRAAVHRKYPDIGEKTASAEEIAFETGFKKRAAELGFDEMTADALLSRVKS